MTDPTAGRALSKELVESLLTKETPEKFWARFWGERVLVGSLNECWPWLRGHRERGYGVVWFTVGGLRKPRGAHRIAYVYQHGPLADGDDVLHSCDTPAYCNPAHLSVGTQRENMRQMYERGRDAWTRGRHPHGRNYAPKKPVDLNEWFPLDQPADVPFPEELMRPRAVSPSPVETQP